MAECRSCGSEALLHKNGIPICVKCVDVRDERRKRLEYLGPGPDLGDPNEHTFGRICGLLSGASNRSATLTRDLEALD